MSRRSGGGTRHAASTHASPPAYVAVLGAALLSYINALGGDFVHDDLPAVTRNRDVIGATSLSQLLRDDFWGTPMGDAASHKSYRPLTTLSFRLTYLLVGAAPGWFHATNVALHAAASLLFTKLCVAVAGFLPAFATLAGLLFAAHPVHTEAVTGVVGRADVLACVLLLLSLLAYHGQEKPKLWTSVFLAALAMLAKETGVAALLLNLLLDVCRSWRVLARSVQEARCAPEVRMFSRRAASLLVALSALLILRLALLQGSLPRFSSQDNPAAFHPCRYVRFLTFCYLAAFNCWLLLCPTTLSHDWQMGSVPLVTHPTDPRNIATAAFFCCGLILLYRGLGELEQQKSPAVLLGLLLLSLPFLPASNLLLTVGFVLAERVLYMPSLGAVLLVSYGAQLLWTGIGNRARSCVLLSAILLIAAFGGRTFLRNRDWISRETLTRAGLKALPHNAKMHYNLANFLRETGRLEQAMSHYTEALRLWPDYASAHNNLGTLLEGAKAESHFIAAIGLAPAHVHAHYNLGQLYRKENRTHESVRVLERCVRLEPGYTPAHLLLARLYAQLGLEERAGKLLRHVVHAHPRCPDRLAHYAAWLHKQGRACEALLYYTKALTEKSSHTEALLGAARVLRSQGQLMRLHRLMLRNLGTSRLSGLLYSGDIYVRTWKLGSEYQSALSDSKPTNACTDKCSSCPVTSSRRHWRRFVVNRTLVLRPAKVNSNHRLTHQSYPLNYVPQERQLPADALLSCETTSAPKDFSTELTTG